MPPLLAHRDMSKHCMAHAPLGTQNIWMALRIPLIHASHCNLHFILVLSFHIPCSIVDTHCLDSVPAHFRSSQSTAIEQHDIGT